MAPASSGVRLRPIAPGLVGLAVNQRARANHCDLRRRRSGLLRAHKRGEHSGEHQTQNHRQVLHASPPKPPVEIHRMAYSLLPKMI